MKTKLLLLIALFSQIFFGQITTDNLIAYYPFDANTQNAIVGGGAYNLLGYGLGNDINFVFNGGVTGGSINNSNCYQFNGGKSLMATNFFGLLDGNPNQSFSVSYWVWYNSVPSLSGLNTQIEAFSSLFLRGNISYGVNTSANGTGGFNLGSDVNTTFTSLWYHMTIVFDASAQTLKIYRNGNQIGTTVSTSGSAIFKYNNRFVIGGGSNADGSAAAAKGFSGKIDEVYVFNKALNQNEITALFAKQVPTSTCPPGNVTFTTQAEVNAFVAQYPNCTEINGLLTINGGNINNLSGLSNITSITNGLTISQCNTLASLNGLQNITTINGNISITNNPLLVNLTGLNGLTALNNNSSGTLGNIFMNNNSSLTSLDGLQNLTNLTRDNLANTRTGFAIYNCNSLTDISALGNINNAVAEYIVISNNTTLNNCAIATVCNKLAIDTNWVTISGNATGCESITAVNNACVALSVEGFNQASFDVFPIPFKDNITINLSRKVDGVLKIVDLTGKILHQSNLNNSEITINNLGHYSNGIYVLQIETSNGEVYNQKIIK